MGKSTSFTIGEHFETFIADKISDGQYCSASEVVRAGLRMLEEHEVKVAAVRQALIHGEQSGRAENFSFDALNAKLDNAEHS